MVSKRQVTWWPTVIFRARQSVNQAGKRAEWRSRSAWGWKVEWRWESGAWPAHQFGRMCVQNRQAAPKFYAIDSHNVNTEAATNDSLIRFLALERAATASPIAAVTRFMQKKAAGSISEHLWQPGNACRWLRRRVPPQHYCCPILQDRISQFCLMLHQSVGR